MLSSSQEDNLKTVHETDNEIEETINHLKNQKINSIQNYQEDDQEKYNTNRYPQARYTYINSRNHPQKNNFDLIGKEMMTPIAQKYVNPEKNKQQNKTQIQNWDDDEDLKIRNNNPRSRLMNDSEDELQQELKNTQRSLQRLKQQQEFVSTGKFHSQKVADTLPYQAYRDRFIQEKNDLRHNLHTPEDLVVRTPNNYKNVKKNFYDPNKPFYNNDNNQFRTLDEAIAYNLEEKSMIERIQRDIDRDKNEFQNNYQKNHLNDKNQNLSQQNDFDTNKDYFNREPQNKNAQNIDNIINSNIIDDEKIREQKIDYKKRMENPNADQLVGQKSQALDHYPHSLSNNVPQQINQHEELEKYNQLVYPESYQETQRQMQEIAMPRQITPPDYKEIYLDKQNKELFYPRNELRSVPQVIEYKNKRNKQNEAIPIGDNNENKRVKDLLLKSKIQQIHNQNLKDQDSNDLTYNFKTNETQMNMHYLNNKYFKQEPQDDQDKQSNSSLNVQQSIRDYKKQKEALKSTIKKRMTPSTDDENFDQREKTDFEKETQTPKNILSNNTSIRGTPNSFIKQNHTSVIDPKRKEQPLTELDVDKTQLINRRTSSKHPYSSFISEIPLSTRNSQRRDQNGNPLLNNDFAPRISSSTRNSEVNQRYSSQPRSSQKVNQKFGNFVNQVNEKFDSKMFDQQGINIYPSDDNNLEVIPKNQISYSVKKSPNNILSLDMSGIGNLEDQIQMQSARIPKKSYDLRTQSVHMTPKDNTRENIFRQINGNQGNLSQKKDKEKHYFEPQIDDFAIIDRKKNNGRVDSLNNSRIDSDLSNRNILQKPILYPSRKLPSLNQGKNELYESKCCHDKRQKNTEQYPQKKYSYQQNHNCSKQIKNPGQACLKCPVCTAHLRVERLGYN